MKQEKPPAAPMVVVEVDVAVTSWRRVATLWAGVLLAAVSNTSMAVVLEEDRADIMYHSYDGGGVTIDGPAVLVRKGFKEKVSVSASFYQDLVSSASIDVLSTGSKYSEERTEYGVGVDYLADKAILSLGFGNSAEEDFTSDTYRFDVSQDFFGDMTTLSMGYSYSDNWISRNDMLSEGEERFEREAKQQRYRLGLTQILTRNWILALNAESIIDGGYLNNPYRQVRFAVDSDAGGSADSVGWQPEVYPETRNSDAITIRTSYYLPYRASLRFEARAFHDSWGISAQNYELRYSHPLREKMILELKMRTYTQSEAHFYQDLFPHRNAQEFMARDKELSQFSSNNLGLGITYQFDKALPFADKQSMSLFWDFIQYDYDNFRNQLLSRSEDDSRARYRVGEEPTYGFEANVLRVFFAVFY